ncbi:MAG: glycosyltransferase [bacterium]|nr:glycosyltransferase [bacterium]
MTPRRTGLPSLEHLLQLTDDCGTIQHATFDVPNRAEGYCVDDVARALIVAVRMAAIEGLQPATRKLAVTALAFLHHAQREDGRFHNFLGYDHRWLDDVGSEDAFGRALWALGTALALAPETSWRAHSRAMLERALPNTATLEHLRPKAYASLGLVMALGANSRAGEMRTALRALLDDLTAARERHGDPSWRWFEPRMVYANARLPEALLRGGAALGDSRAMALGAETLGFLESVTLERGLFVPIGNHGWYPRGGERAVYAQQPIEACAMVEAELAAYDATQHDHHLYAAGIAFDWFFGHNLNGAVMVQGGGCRDGLERDCVNRNMGAESTLSYLLAAAAMATRPVWEQRGVHR